MRLPTFSRQSETDNTDRDRPTTPMRDRNDRAHTVAAPNDATTTRFTTAGAAADRAKAEADRAHADRVAARRDTPPAGAVRTDERPDTDREPVAAGPKPRASLLATLGLILAVGGALLVLSGPLLGYGIGVSALALILSVAGLRATRRRHVAGKTDALIGTILSLAAITVGVLALAGMLTWLGTDMQPVNSLREWLDAQFVNRF